MLVGFLDCVNVRASGRTRLAIQFVTVKSPLYLIKNLPGGQLPHVLWR